MNEGVKEWDEEVGTGFQERGRGLFIKTGGRGTNDEKGRLPRWLLPHTFQAPVLPGPFLIPETNRIEPLL